MTFRSMRHLEAQSQRALIKWWACAHNSFGVKEHLLVSFPNGGRRGKIEASLMKLEGCRAGAPDLILLAPRAHYHGMAIELKTETGKLSPKQKEFMNDLAEQGYWTGVCHNTESAINAITSYLRLTSLVSPKFQQTEPAVPACHPHETPSQAYPPGFSYHREHLVRGEAPQAF